MNEAGSAVGFSWRDSRSAVITGWVSDSAMLSVVTLEEGEEVFANGS
jgi:hypothetical protein